MRYRNILTGATVTVTKINKEKKQVEYDRDYTTPPQTTFKGERTKDGKISHIKPSYVFKQCYRLISVE